MATKKAPAKKTTKTAKSDATPKEIIAKYDCLQTHVMILTVLSGLILISVIVLTIILVKCDDCKVTPKADTSSKVEPREKPDELPEDVEDAEE